MFSKTFESANPPWSPGLSRQEREERKQGLLLANIPTDVPEDRRGDAAVRKMMNAKAACSDSTE